jgi:beta-xylosidase
MRRTESTDTPAARSRRRFLLGLGGALAATPLLAHSPAAAEPPETYTNPLDVKIADPYVLREPDGPYYMYGSGSGAATTAFPTFRSSDLVHWTPIGETYQRNPSDSWCIDFFWAPEAYHVKDRYYMVYSAQWRDNPTNEKENFRVGAAVSDKPGGPFRDVRNAPLFDPGYPAIDADVLFDTDGRMYMFYSRCCYKHPVESELAEWARKEKLYSEIEESWIYGVEVKPDFSGIIGEPVMMLRPPVTLADKSTAWENLSVTTHEVNRRWTEGPTAFKHGDTYYLMYSANHYLGENYSLGYATAKHPLGPYTKAANNPVLRKNTDRGGVVSGPAHNCVTLSPDGTEMMCLYAGRTAATGSERVLLMDRMEIRRDGTLVVHGPTTTPQPVPSARKTPLV